MINVEERGKTKTKHHKEAIPIVDITGNVAMLAEDLKIDKTQKPLQRNNLTLQKNKKELQFTM